ncbi:glycoside hydrolase domain-containing protein [Evansella sp. AB-rgal1]|uniref:glycoside hydrolase domain-containing protein n=1 Tax=Evansella sp. AB-rgal1 TaxID=3242696 RepID=UPI00359DBEC1
MSNIIWGVDSAAAATESLYDCVVRNFGQPDVWGRYLNTIPNVSEGLSRSEILYLKGKGVKILPIYNNFREAVGATAGRIAAQNAIYNAHRLGIPKGVFIFANVERFFEVDADWIIAWVEKFYNSDYRPGIYHDPTEGPFNEAYCEAIQRSELVRTQTVLWSAEPETGITRKANIPVFNPKTPNCAGNVWAWQYGRDAEECPIDTVLLQKRLYDELY